MNQVIYAAGFFDGEGSIQIQSSHWGFRIEVTQTMRKPLEIFKHFWGGKIIAFQNKGRDTVYHRWQASGKDAVRALSDMLPYLIVKRRQAMVAIEFAATAQRGRKLSPEVIETRKKLLLQLHAA